MSFQVSQGSVETLFRCGGKRLHDVAAYFFQRTTHLISSESQEFCRKYYNNILVFFSRHTIYNQRCNEADIASASAACVCLSVCLSVCSVVAWHGIHSEADVASRQAMAAHRWRVSLLTSAHPAILSRLYGRIPNPDPNSPNCLLGQLWAIWKISSRDVTYMSFHI